MRVKICGVTSVDDALGCVEAGADAIGLNFWPKSVRRCDEAEARRIVAAVGDRARVVAVVVDAGRETMRRLRDEVGVRWLQLHGDETPEQLAEWLPEAYKAVRPASAADLSAARAYGGEELLVDARVAGAPGGTGVRADWSLAAELARERSVWLAGGLSAENVAEAVAAVRPYGVDVASGVESEPGRKDLEKVRAFVEAARG
jgi:phosphoribosylanthranilate isomerase